MLAVALAGLAASVANACSSDSSSDAKGCEPQSTRECTGPGACKGGQVCGADRTWSACDCGGSTGGTGGTVAGGAGGTGGSSASGGTAGTGASTSGGTGGVTGGGGAPSGGSGGDASADGPGDTGSDAVDTGVGPNDDPCPAVPINVNCSESCGPESQGCYPQCNTYYTVNPVTDSTIAKYFVIRTPSSPGVPVTIGCACSSDAGPLPVYWIHLRFQGVDGESYKITVGKPWRVWGVGNGNPSYPGSCLTDKYANGCSVSGAFGQPKIHDFFIGTDDPNAPARNVVIQKVIATPCAATEYWQ